MMVASDMSTENQRTARDLTTVEGSVVEMGRRFGGVMMYVKFIYLVLELDLDMKLVEVIYYRCSGYTTRCLLAPHGAGCDTIGPALKEVAKSRRGKKRNTRSRIEA